MPQTVALAPKRSQWIAIAAVVLVVLAAMWEAMTAGPLFGSLESGYGAFARQFPAFGAIVLMLVPILVILAVLGYINRREGGVGDATLPLVRGTRLLRVLGVACGTVALAAVIALLVPLTLPDGTAPSQQVDTRTTIDPANGAVTLKGPLIAGRAVRYEKWIGAASRVYLLAPVTATASDGGALRYFVEVSDMAGTAGDSHSGLLVRNGLPSGARDAFVAAGYQVTSPSEVLFQDSASVRWPYYALAVQLLVIAALLLLAATVQWFTVRRIQRSLTDDV